MVILYEDNHCIAVVKPHGLPTQSDASGDPSLLEEVKAMIKERDAKPGNVFLGLLHRLDRPVGGIVLFGKTSKGASRLSDQFRTHAIKKTYLAVVEGGPQETEGEVRHWLLKDEDKNTVKVVPPGTLGAKEAVLSYRVIKSIDDRTLVEIRPETGRPHQIRVAMASLGAPIVGDLKYGAHQGLGNAIALFASRLEFKHPTTAEPIVLEAKPDLEPYRAF